MIAKRAESLSPWSLEDLDAGKYAPQSVVYFKPQNSFAGYAFKATYQFSLQHPKARFEPDKAPEIWQIDKSYASEWRSDGRYSYYPLKDTQGNSDFNFATRVYHFNGQRGYIYRTTPRYVGGTLPPNEEVDLDGYRTWELDFEYDIYGGNYFDPPSRVTRWGFPVFTLKKVGFQKNGNPSFGGGGGDWESSDDLNLDPNWHFPWTGRLLEGDGGVEYYDDPKFVFDENGNIIWADDKYISELPRNWWATSVFESNPYDEYTYAFSPSGFQKGMAIHRGVLEKKEWDEFLPLATTLPTDYASNIKRQLIYIDHSTNYNHHYSALGFSAEFWQNISESNFEVNYVTSQNWIGGGFSYPYYEIGWTVFVMGRYSLGNEGSFGAGSPRGNGIMSIATYGAFYNYDGVKFYDADPSASSKAVYFTDGSSGDPDSNTKLAHFLGRTITISVLFVTTTSYWKFIPSPYGEGGSWGLYKTPYTKTIQKFQFKISEQEMNFMHPEVTPFAGRQNIQRIGTIDLSGYAKPLSQTMASIVGMELSD